jgi:isopenicillin-N N-acyltransferase-like protein
MELFRRQFISPSFEEILDLAGESIPFTDKYAPDLVEEIRGIAEGSGFKFEEIFALNSVADIEETLSVRAARDELAPSCSSYAVGKGSTLDGDTYVGWNNDWHKSWLRSTVLIKGKPHDGPPFLLSTNAGWVGRPGLNPHLGLAANGLFPSDCSPGVPYPVVCRKILQQRSVADAVAVISEMKRMGGMNYTLGDVEGNVAAVETTARRCAVIRDTNGKVVHTNHFVTEELLSYEVRIRDSFVNSQKRLERLKELLMEREASSITVKDLETMHRDHANRPDSICRHSEEGMTLASLICQPSQSMMLVAYGHPCEHEFVEYAL